MNKRGLSPIVATLLLISIALILALIIFLWARSFLAEKTLKFEKPIEQACDGVGMSLSAVASSGNVEVSMTNDGSVAIFDLNIVAITNDGDSPLTGDSSKGTVGPGFSKTYTKPCSSCGSQSKLEVTPMIVGTNAEGIKKTYTCDGKKQTITVE